MWPFILLNMPLYILPILYHASNISGSSLMARQNIPSALLYKHIIYTLHLTSYNINIISLNSYIAKSIQHNINCASYCVTKKQTCTTMSRASQIYSNTHISILTRGTDQTSSTRHPASTTPADR